MSTKKSPNNPGQQTSAQPLVTSAPSDANRQCADDENFARMLQAQFDAELQPPNALQPQSFPNPFQVNIQEDFYNDGGAIVNRNQEKRKRESSDDEVVLLHQATSGGSGQQYQTQPSTSGHQQAQPSTSGHQEVMPSARQLFYESEPTSPDPVEMVRRFEWDEMLARELQDHQVEPDHYVEDVEENERAALQLMHHELQELLQEPIRPQISAAGSQETDAVIVTDKVQPRLEQSSIQPVVTGELIVNKFSKQKVTVQNVTTQKVATQSAVQNVALQNAVARESIAQINALQNEAARVIDRITFELTAQNSAGRNSAIQNVAEKRVKDTGMPVKTIEEINKKIAKNKESDFEIKEEDSEKLTCKICLDKRVTIAFQPCGHLTVCQECSQPLKKCPMCRAKVTKKMKIYFT